MKKLKVSVTLKASITLHMHVHWEGAELFLYGILDPLLTHVQSGRFSPPSLLSPLSLPLTRTWFLWFSLVRFLSTNGSLINRSHCYKKKVLLRERKSRTACRVVSTPSVVLTGYPPILTWPGGMGGYPAGGLPCLGVYPTGVPCLGGTLPGGYPTWVPPVLTQRGTLPGEEYPTWVPGRVPPCWTWLHTPPVSAPWHSG